MLTAITNAFKLKSKTINANVAAAILANIANQLGFTIPIEVLTSSFVLLNFILRLITKQPLEDK